MAVSFGNFTSDFLNATDDTPGVAVPAGGATGDKYILAVVWSGAPGTVTPPAGFSQVGATVNEPGFGAELRVYERTHTGSEGATFDFSTTAFRQWSTCCVIVKDANATIVTSNAAAGTVAFLSAGTPNNGTTGSVTRTAANQTSLVIGCTASDGTANTPTYTNPSGTTLLGTGDNGLGRTMRGTYVREASSGATNYAFSATYTAAASFVSLGTAIVFEDTGSPVFTVVLDDTLAMSDAVAQRDWIRPSVLPAKLGEFDIGMRLDGWW